MSKFISEEVVEIKDTPFKDYTIKEWTLYFIGEYGMDDGAHHKHWLLDQIAKINTGNKIIISLIKYTDRKDYYNIEIEDEKTKEYLEWTGKYNFDPET
jgi:hypothetical protein